MRNLRFTPEYLKTELLIVNLTDKLISNIFSCVKTDFLLSQKIGTIGIYAKTFFEVKQNSVHFIRACISHNRRGSYTILVNIICDTLPHYVKNKEYIL